MSKPGGRPSHHVDQLLCIRIDQNTRNALVVLASNWQVKHSEAVRRAIKQCAGWDRDRR